MSEDQLSSTFAALADPTRRAILARLANGEAMVSELAAPFAMTLPAVSKHLKVLERAGLIARGRTAQWRPCRLEVGPLFEVSDWLKRYRLFWEGGFDRLDEHLQEITREATAMTETVSAATGRTDRELTITRVFDAPRELVFKAWTQPERMTKWWGPRGCVVPASTITTDLVPGGGWRLLMVSEDGTESWQRGVFCEIREPERLVFTFAWEEPGGAVGNETLVTITFADRGGKTEMTFHQAVFVSIEDRDGHLHGWSSCMDRLAEYVAGR